MPAIPAIAIAVTVVAAAATAAAAYSSAQSQKNAANYNAQMEQYNAEIQNQQGQQDAQNIEEQGEIIQGKARAAAAASGLFGGSSDDIQYVDLVRNDQDALAAKYRAEIGAYNATSQAGLDTMNASAANTAGAFSAGGALLNGAGQSFNQYNASYGNNNSVTPVFAANTSSGSPGF